MSYLENAKKLKAQIDENQKTVDMINAAGGITVTITQSDKLGFNWENYYVNETLVRQVYVEQENPVGTADNPIVWESGIKLIQNAYYINGDVRKVWMGESGVTAEWDDENFVIF